VTVTSQDDATFSLTPTCDGATASISGTTGGTFTFTTPPTDAAIIDASTGTVTNGEPSNNYNVTYTTVGTCPTFSNQTITTKPLLTPTITCGTNSRSTVSFEWSIPSGATNYNISYVINNTTTQTVVNQTENSLTVNGLNVDNEVVITITTNGSECYDDVSHTCFAASCIPSQALFYPDPKTVTASVPKTTFINSSTNSIGYFWDFGDGNTSNEPDPEHEYVTSDVEVYNVMLIAFNEDACNDTIIQSVLVSEELIYYVPNSFTPNEDQFNNEFLPVFYSGYDPYNYSMYIFDRWGEIVFETHDIEKGWNGTYGSSDKKVQDGVYIWKIEFKRKGIDKIEKAMGHVILNR
jgi:gliding motility-associated-like protein